MGHYYCEIYVATNNPWILRIEVKKNWSRHDIIMHSLRRGYITRDEAAVCRQERIYWLPYTKKEFFPLDLKPYQWQERDRYVVKEA